MSKGLEGYEEVNPFNDDEPFALDAPPASLGHVWRCPRCGTTRLEIVCSDHFETSARCPDCKVWWVVHDG